MNVLTKEKNKENWKSMFKVEVSDVAFVCPKHGNIRAKRYLSKDSEDFICPLCKKESEEEAKKLLEKKRLESELKEQCDYFKTCNIEPEFFWKTLDDYKAKTESQESALKATKELLCKKITKLVLLGDNGVGKTFLGSMAVKTLGGKIYSMYEIATMIRQSYSPSSTKTELEIVRELAEIPMLVIDELGRTKGSESEMNWLSYVLDKRHTRKLPFMLLSNKKLFKDCKKDDCFEKYIDNDVLSRLRQDSKIITIKAPDFRATER